MDTLTKIILKDFMSEQKYNIPNSRDSIDVINAKLRKINENLEESKYYISFSDYKDLVNNIREIAKNSEYCRVYHTFVDLDMKFYGINESEKKLKDSSFDCYITKFMVEIKKN